jgi:hypothetical protein
LEEDYNEDVLAMKDTKELNDVVDNYKRILDGNIHVTIDDSPSKRTEKL